MNPFLLFRGERWVSVTSAVAIHLLVLFGANIAFLKAAEYGVQSGVGGIEVNLIAALPETQMKQIQELPHEETTTMTPFAPKDEDMLLPEKSKSKEVKKSAPTPENKQDRKNIINPSPDKGDGSSPIPGKSSTSFYSSGGADTEAKPNYLKNPAPEYPEISKQNNEQGVVVLKVFVEKDGRPTQVILDQSSGFHRLDSSALKAVKDWKFSPARVGNMVFSSWVKIPIRFVLEEK